MRFYLKNSSSTIVNGNVSFRIFCKLELEHREKELIEKFELDKALLTNISNAAHVSRNANPDDVSLDSLSEGQIFKAGSVSELLQTSDIIKSAWETLVSDLEGLKHLASGKPVDYVFPPELISLYEDTKLTFCYYCGEELNELSGICPACGKEL